MFYTFTNKQFPLSNNFFGKIIIFHLATRDHNSPPGDYISPLTKREKYDSSQNFHFYKNNKLHQIYF